MKNSIKVLIVDDSKLIRSFLHEIFESDERFQVAGEAKDGAEALEMLDHLRPDAVTMDINMPVMDGLTALKHIMIRRPTPVVMVSTLTQSGAKATFDALKYGAVDFIRKPGQSDDATIRKRRLSILDKVHRAASVQIGAARLARVRAVPSGEKKACDLPQRWMIGLTASEGGYGALLKIVPRLGGEIPAAAVALLHEPKEHVEAFCEYLDRHSAVRVLKAENGARLESGVCMIASTEDTVDIVTQPGECRLEMAQKEMAMKPDEPDADPADRFLSSLAESWAARAIGVVLSGSGTDGLSGAEKIARKKGTVVVQAPETCLQKETPALAIEMVETSLVLPDSAIAGALDDKCREE